MSAESDAFCGYRTQVDRLITTMIASALESGIGHSQAVTLSIATFKEVEVVARDTDQELLPEPTLEKVYTFCCAILASGTTFSPFEIAQRAVMAAKAAEQELEDLWRSWDPAKVDVRVKWQGSHSHRRVTEEHDGNVRRGTG